MRSTTLTLRGDQIRLGGGCDGTSPLSLGFSSGIPTSDDWAYLGFDTAEAVGTGQTGSVPI